MKNKILPFLAAALLAAFFAVSSSAVTRKTLDTVYCDCGQDPCTCFLQLDDHGPVVKAVVNMLMKKGYIEKQKQVDVYTEAIMDAVVWIQLAHGLPTTGTLDDVTLTWLIWDMSPEELDKEKPISSIAPETWPYACFVPSDGGKKRHSEPTCSQMFEPRKMSIRNAAALGIDACKRCETKRESELEIIIHREYEQTEPLPGVTK